ncbi:ABC transporter substrate-binding protein [Chelativorans sp. AA-79]|uniref:ABC transporter substrate-binding protein n=1 Tax=Chelativorans sp. AA-79 TaxID=3028735 RepID=UPI0023F83EB6|nr:ABC transporter substrate-binding protein [Chelativorans sp. AA-79]WEX11100.1 ABC transporter substrate-binding protein [Chelativorans sp. AA-79]
MKRRFAFLLAAALIATAPGATAATPDDQLVVGMSMNNITTLDPAAMAGRESTGIATNVYDTLVRLDPIEKTKVHPGLAESWEISDDGSSITFHLREGAKFASGNPVTADDVLWSYKRNVELGLVGAGVWLSFGFTPENFDQYVRAEGNAITITLPEEGDPRLLLYMFGKPDAAAVIDSELAMEHASDGDKGQGWLTTNTAGSGPFKLTNFTANDVIVLERNENYWDDPASMTRVIFRHMPESQTKRLMLERGDIDVGLGLSVPDINALSSNSDVEVQPVPGAGFYYLGVSMKDERFANPKVREALRYLIDYDGINATIMPNYGVERQRPVALGVLGALEDPGYALDVEKAKALLAEAGYPDGFEVELLALNEAPFLDAATAIQGTLAQAGIRANIVTGNGNQVYGPMRERNFEMIVGRGGGGQEPHPHSNLRAMVVNPDNSDDAGLSGVIVWRTSFYDEELNAMAAEALTIRDTEKQADAYEAIQQRLEEVVPALLIFSQVVDTVVFRSDVEDYQNHYGWTTRLEEVHKDR